MADPEDLISLAAVSCHDMADYLQERIIKHPESRTSEMWEAMKGFYGEYRKRIDAINGEPEEDQQLQECRLRIRYQMCQILMLACSWLAYDFDQQAALVNWNDQQWAQLLEILTDVQDQCDTQTKRYTKTLLSCKINRSLSLVRRDIELSLRENAVGPPEVGQEAMQNTRRSVQDGGLEVQAQVQQLFVSNGDGQTSFRCVSALGPILESRNFSLSKLQDKIGKVVFEWNAELFELDEAELWSVGYNVPLCLRSPAEEVIPLRHRDHDAAEQDDPHILQTSAHNPRSERARGIEGRSKPVRKGHPVRQTLDRSVEEERDESGSKTSSKSPPQHRHSPRRPKHRYSTTGQTTINDPPRAPPKPHLARQTPPGRTRLHRSSVSTSRSSEGQTPNSSAKPRYMSLQTSPGRKRKNRSVCSDDSSDEISEIGSPVALGTIPKRQILGNLSPFYVGKGPDDGRFDETGRVKQRVPWSEQEVQALKSGLARHGVGKWVQIKTDFDSVLRNRTSVMLKDKFRNLVKHGEVDTSGTSLT